MNPEDILNRSFVMTDVAGGSAVAGIYLNMIWTEIQTQGSPIVVLTYKQIEQKSLLTRHQQDLAVSKLRALGCISIHRHIQNEKCVGISVSVDVPALEKKLVYSLFSVREAE